MLSIRVLRPPAPGDVETVHRLVATAALHDGHESLGSFVERDLDAPSPESIGILVTDGTRPIGYAHLAPSDTLADPHVVAALVVDPGHRTDTTVTRALLEGVVREAKDSDLRIVLWVNGADDTFDALVESVGFTRVSEQYQMRVPLPLAESPQWPSGITVRAFVPGQDDAAWLRVNNRAFDNHPDQGDWVEATLQRRLAESWFDPAGFLMAFERRRERARSAEAGATQDDERRPERARSAEAGATQDDDADGLAGFCWTKVHDDEPDGPIGEIYVIGVDPDRQGLGLGRALTVGGLEYLAKQRHCPIGMLYVDGANPPALGLYRALGFVVHRTDRAYAWIPGPA